MNLSKDISILVSELSKQKPNLVLIQTMCEKTGFLYSNDLIQLMSDILINIGRPVKNLKKKQPLVKNQIKNNDQTRI